MKNDIIVHKKIQLENPILLAGWPGMGNVAIGAMDYFREKTNAEFFAEINITKYLLSESVVVNNGIAQMPRPYRNYFYYAGNPPIIFFESEVQMSGEGAMNLLDAIITFCRDMGVQKIFTGAAFSLPVSHREPSEVYGVGSNDAMVEFYRQYAVKPMAEGQISGLNGMLIGYAKESNIDALCLLATMPVYAVNFPNPKASKALVEVMGRMTGIQVDLKDMDKAVNEMEQKMESIENNLKELFPERKESPHEKKPAEQEKQDKQEQSVPVPPHVQEKIERLFREAREDRAKAGILKEELDRWNLYKMYEDRFLNLFKEKH